MVVPIMEHPVVRFEKYSRVGIVAEIFFDPNFSPRVGLCADVLALQLVCESL